MLVMPENTVLVLTNRYDPTADLVIGHLHERGVPVFRCDTSEFPAELAMSAELDRGWSGTFATAQRRVDLASIRSVYVRRPEEFRFPQRMSETARLFAAAQCRAGFLGVIGARRCRWVNHPARDSDCSYKPWQLAVARDVGLNPPRTIVTNDPDSARRFANSLAGPALTKSLGSGFLDGNVRRGTATTVVDAATFDDSIRLCAHLFQEWIEKSHDVRLTVVGDRLFPVAIHAHSAAGRIDWRTDYDSLSYEETTAPDQVQIGVHALLRHFGLTFGAFDFAVTPDGEWRFLEVNPNGQWAWLEHATGLPMSSAIADVLQEGLSGAD